MKAFDRWLKSQNADILEDLDSWSASQGWDAAMKYASNHLHDVMMGLRYGANSDDERCQFASSQIERCRDDIAGA